MTKDLQTVMMDAALAASAIILDVYDSDFAATEKKDGSPVTIADHRAELAIEAALAATGIPVLGEERAAAGENVALGRRFFVVDPLDGTKEFLKRNGEFTVNIALVEDGRPTHGVIVAPALGKAYWGGPEGAFEYEYVRPNKQSDGSYKLVGPVSVSKGGDMDIVASRSHGHQALGVLCEIMQVRRDVSIGSSLKFCLVARGDARLYPRLTPTCEWDTAAGQAVLEAAGGVVVTLEGTPLTYGKGDPKHLNPFFVAAADLTLAKEAAGEMRRLLTQS